MPIDDNEALYSLLGNMYGGDGVSNFALPDLREKDANGLPCLGFTIGKPTYIICINGRYPMRG